MALLLAAASALPAQDLRELCGACHSEPASDFASHPHMERGLSCDACHGKSEAHRAATGHKPPDKIAGPSDQPQVCGACHPAERKSYESSTHGKLVLARDAKRAAACTTCHGTHALRSVAAMSRQCGRCHEALPESCKRPPAPTTSKLLCANCHDKHTLRVAGR
ncbi:MAG: cytochrome c3 family protein [Bryobacteraceae bacterium]